MDSANFFRDRDRERERERSSATTKSAWAIFFLFSFFSHSRIRYSSRALCRYRRVIAYNCNARCNCARLRADFLIATCFPRVTSHPSSPLPYSPFSSLLNILHFPLPSSGKSVLYPCGEKFIDNLTHYRGAQSINGDGGGSGGFVISIHTTRKRDAISVLSYRPKWLRDARIIAREGFYWRKMRTMPRRRDVEHGRNYERLSLSVSCPA